MPSDIEFGIAAMFRNATQQGMVLELRKPSDWERFNAIDHTARQRTKEEVDGFEQNRSERLSAARKGIIDKAGARRFEHPTPFGIDKFNPSEIERQAVAKIFNDHHSNLIGIKNDEVAAYDALREDIHAREGVGGHARDAFARATERGMGGERQIPARNR